MRVLIAAAIAALALTTTAHADLRYYVDQDVLHQDVSYKNDSNNGSNHGSGTLLDRAMRDVGRNPTGWSHRWCGRQMAMWVGQGPNLARAWAHYGRATTARPGAIGVMNGHV